MTLTEIILLALVQGITEFLPISSTAHLILPSQLGWIKDQGPLIDMALHVGTLLAVIVAFWPEVLTGFAGLGDLLRGRWKTNRARLALNLIVATVPVLIAGYTLHALALQDAMRAVALIAWTTLIFGVALYIADRFMPQDMRLRDLTVLGAVLVGLAQAVALVPGVSRSGVTMTASRFLGLNRTDAARFSMLMAIPTILAAGALGTKDILESGDVQLGLNALIAVGLSFVAALAAIRLFMRWIARSSMTPFVIYRLALGAVLLWVAYA